MHTITIFYDAHCGICSRFRKWMEAQSSYVRLEFIPYDHPIASFRCPGIERMGAGEEIIVMGDDGSIWQGAGAWVTCLWALQEYREWSARLANPAMMAVARNLVQWISSHRIRLSKLLRFQSDEELAAAGGGCVDDRCEVENRRALEKRWGAPDNSSPPST